jgi:CHAD domain-containing protein
VHVSLSSQNTKKQSQKAGLRFWMDRVLKECDKVSQDFAADPVHDLRVALRRCHSTADGLMTIDPDKSWKKMKRAGKPLFQSLGDLRDAQVMMEWVARLGAPDDPVTKSLLDYTKKREHDLKAQAMSELQAFDRKQWETWSKELPRRAARIRLGSLVFKHMALERWTEARKLHATALRTGSPAALHVLRIAIKRFRYTVENFLPQLHHAWIDDLKDLQDSLGEVHDLDVLWATALEIGAFPEDEARKRWHTKINEEKAARIEKYRSKMAGKHSRWNVWRAGLPRGEQISAAALSRLKAWASFLDPDFSHSQRVANIALQLYDGLTSNGLADNRFSADGTHQDLRTVLYAAALMHDAGRSHREKGHHRTSSRLIRTLTPPLGWTAHDLALAGVVARYHRGGLPQSRHKALSNLPPDQRASAICLAGILRLANGFDLQHDGRIARLEVKSQDGALVIRAQGYSPYSQIAEEVASARFLLERTLRRAIIVRPLAAKKKTQVSRGVQNRKPGA